MMRGTSLLVSVFVLIVKVLKALSRDRVQQRLVVLFKTSPSRPPRREEEEDEEDEDPMVVTQPRFPGGFQPMRMCRWFLSGYCRQGLGCTTSARRAWELHPRAR